MNDQATPSSDQQERKENERREFRSYVWGLGLALLLTLVPFALVYWDVLSRAHAFLAVGILALLQMIVHFRFFLHIGLQQRREDLHLILFSALILVIMVAGTIWIMFNLALRMSPLAP